MHYSRTLPVEMPTPVLLVDVVDAREYGATAATRDPSTMGPTTLSSVLRREVLRFDKDSDSRDLLPIVAASIRHLRPVTLHVAHGTRVVALSVFPREQQFHCSVNLSALAPHDTARLRLVHIGHTITDESASSAHATSPCIANLSLLLWQLAMHGSRSELLPEIAGAVHYRLAPGAPLRSLPIEPWSTQMLAILRRQPVTIKELAAPSLASHAQATRLLNGIYLQGRLMITRSLPARTRQATVRWSVN